MRLKAASPEGEGTKGHEDWLIMNVFEDPAVTTATVYVAFRFALITFAIAKEIYGMRRKRSWYDDYSHAIRKDEFEEEIYGIRKSKG